MTVCVYYDLASVDRAAVAAALAAAPASAERHLHAGSAEAEQAGDLDVAITSIPGVSDGDVRSALDPILAALLDAAAAEGDGSLADADMVNGSRHDWRVDALPVLHRPWVATALAERHHADSLVWVTQRHVPGLDTALSAAAGVPVEVVELGASADAAGSRGGGRGSRVRSTAVRALRHRPIRLQPVGAGGSPPALFVEPYAHVAEMSSSIAAALADALPVAYVGGSPAVVAAADPATAPVAIAGVQSRRALVAGARGRRRATHQLVERWQRAVAAVPAIASESRGFMAGALASVSRAPWGAAAAAAPAWDEVVERFEPALVVSTTESRTGPRLAALAARRRGAGFAVIQHGAQRPPAGFLRPIGDAYLVWGGRDADLLSAAGVDRSRIVVTGRPGLAERVQSAQEAARSSARTKGLAVAYVPSVTGAADVPESLAAAMLDAVANAVASIPGASGIVRPHPRDRSGVYELSGRGPLRLSTEGDSFTAMANADVVVVAQGTSGFDACAVDRPIIALGWPGVVVPPELTSSGAAMVSTGPADLAMLLGRARDDPEARERMAGGRAAVVASVFGDARPGAAERIVQVLDDLAR